MPFFDVTVVAITDGNFQCSSSYYFSTMIFGRYALAATVGSLLISSIVGGVYGEQAGLRKEASTSSFPRVYSGVVSRDKTAAYVRGQEEVLDLVSETLSENGDLNVSFMVHSQEEWNRLDKSGMLSENIVSNVGVDDELTLQLERNINRDLETEEKRRKLSKSKYSLVEGFPCFKNLAGSIKHLKDVVVMAKQIPNLEVTLHKIGESYYKTHASDKTTGGGGHDIYALHVTGNGVQATNYRSTTKGIFMIMSGIHARELAPPELVGRWIHHMVLSYGKHADITSILDHTDIHIVLQGNPDARQRSEDFLEEKRRKNMNLKACPDAPIKEGGVDLNRNFPFKWDRDDGSDDDGCSQKYRGASPGSEPEVQAIMKYAKAIFPESQQKEHPEENIFKAYPETYNGLMIDVHSQGQILIWPYSSLEKESGNDAGMSALANKMIHFNDYGRGGPHQDEFLYRSSGTVS